MFEDMVISFPLFGIVVMVLFMVIMMCGCFLIMRVFRRRMGYINGCCRCMEMVCNRIEELES